MFLLLGTARLKLAARGGGGVWQRGRVLRSVGVVLEANYANIFFQER